ncbi:MAG: F0F1 ATP synthase subunit B [Armatimonadota bacterium]|nr:F0F1 ATP synthase subunit B [Armatimonadota bacterium]
MDILNIDPRVLAVQIGGFLLLLVVFKLFLFKPIVSILEARQQEIESRYRDAEERQQVAERLRAEYERHLATIEELMHTKIAEAIKEGQAMRDEIIASARAKAEDILARAEEQIQREKEKAVYELRGLVADLTITVASKLLEEQLDESKHRRLVDRFIEDLDSQITRSREPSGGDV